MMLLSHLLAEWNSRKGPRFKHGSYWLRHHRKLNIKPSVSAYLHKVAITMSALSLTSETTAHA